MIIIEVSDPLVTGVSRASTATPTELLGLDGGGGLRGWYFMAEEELDWLAVPDDWSFIYTYTNPAIKNKTTKTNTLNAILCPSFGFTLYPSPAFTNIIYKYVTISSGLNTIGVLAQLARARHSHCRGRRFDSAILHQKVNARPSSTLRMMVVFFYQHHQNQTLCDWRSHQIC